MILKNGRISNYRPQGMNDEEWDELDNKLQEKDPQVRPLLPIGEEDKVYPFGKSGEDNTAELAGRTDLYPHPSNWLVRELGNK